MPLDEQALARAAAALRSARRIVVYTGAGISVESGVPAFRGGGSLWAEFQPEQFATRSGLLRVALRDSDKFWRFLCAVIGPIADAAPNAAHLAVARLEQIAQVTVVTQNIDGLHQEAGSGRVLEIHGSLQQLVRRDGRSCRRLSRRRLQAMARWLRRAPRPLRLLWSLGSLRPMAGFDWRGVYYPRLVLFGDSLAEPEWTEALQEASRCDCLLQIGCSGQVFPAAMLPMEAKAHGAVVIAVDVKSRPADIWLEGTAASVVPRLIEAAAAPEAP